MPKADVRNVSINTRTKLLTLKLLDRQMVYVVISGQLMGCIDHNTHYRVNQILPQTTWAIVDASEPQRCPTLGHVHVYQLTGRVQALVHRTQRQRLLIEPVQCSTID